MTISSLLSAQNSVKSKRNDIRNKDPLNRPEWAHINVSTPPQGAVSFLADFIDRRAIRRIPDLPVFDALQLVSMIIGDKAKVGSIKTNLMTLTIAPSAAGKDNGQSVLKHAFSYLEQAQYISSQITSQRAIANSMITNKGRANYIIDEAHGFFNAVSDSKAPQYLKQAADDILNFYTADHYFVRDQEQNMIVDKLDRLESLIAKEEKKTGNATPKKGGHDPEKILSDKPAGGLTLPYDPTDYGNKTEKQIRLELEANYLKDVLKKGIKSPQFNAMFYSTPVNLDSVVTPETIESGLIGRTLFNRAPEERATKSRNLIRGDSAPSFDEIYPLLDRLKSIEKADIEFSDDALDLAEDIDGYFESKINDYSMGAIYARGWEKVVKLAALASIGFDNVGANGFTRGFRKIEQEHLAWAFKVVRYSDQNIQNLMTTNSHDESVQDVLFARVQQISNGRKVFASVMIQNLTKAKKMQKIWNGIDAARMHHDGSQSMPNRMHAENYLETLVAQGKLERLEGDRGSHYYRSL